MEDRKLFIERDYEEQTTEDFLRTVLDYYLSDVQLILNNIDELGLDDESRDFYEKLEKFITKIL